MSFDLDKVHLLDPKSILVKRDERQRKLFTTDDLVESIGKRGQMQPIVVEETPEGILLIAGERRLTTFLENPAFGKVKAIFTSDLSPVDRQILELEENLRRQDLSWIEVCDAMLSIHLIYQSEDPEWTVMRTASSLGMTYNSVRQQLQVAEEIRKGNTSLEEASGWTTAFTKLEVQRDRKKEHAQATLTADIAASFPSAKPQTKHPSNGQDPEKGTPEGSSSSTNDSSRGNNSSGGLSQLEAGLDNPVPILNMNSLEFFANYEGIPFNFGHFDFPYGINYQDMDQAHTENHGEYDDRPEVYWELLGSLCSNLDRVFSPSFHAMFWFSPKLYTETLEFFSRNAPDVWVQDVPLIWLKSDNRGILADPLRRPRNITEFAFILSRGDRKIVKPVSNAYAAPTSKTIHGSEKSVPMLKYFFQMFLDANSRMLDPTSGSGNALIAALDFHPASVLGIEKDPTFHSLSVQAYKKVLSLKKLEKKNG